MGILKFNSAGDMYFQVLALSRIKFLSMEERNSTGDGLPLFVKDELCLGRINTTAFGYFYSTGSVCTFSHFLKLTISLYLVGRATVRFGHFLFAPVPGITSKCLLFRM